MQATKEKVVFVLIDGIGDVSIPAFGDRTPLEVAHVPYMDAIAGGPRATCYECKTCVFHIRPSNHSMHVPISSPQHRLLHAVCRKIDISLVTAACVAVVGLQLRGSTDLWMLWSLAWRAAATRRT
jgi:hypothetical protein